MGGGALGDIKWSCLKYTLFWSSRPHLKSRVKLADQMLISQKDMVPPLPERLFCRAIHLPPSAPYGVAFCHLFPQYRGASFNRAMIGKESDPRGCAMAACVWNWFLVVAHWGSISIVSSIVCPFFTLSNHCGILHLTVSASDRHAIDFPCILSWKMSKGLLPKGLWMPAAQLAWYESSG